MNNKKRCVKNSLIKLLPILALSSCLLQVSHVAAETVANINFIPLISGSTSKALSSLDQYVTPMGFHIGTVVPNNDNHWQGITRHPSALEYFYVAKGGSSDTESGLFTIRIGKNNSKSTFVGNLLLSQGKNAFEVDPGESKVVNEQIRTQGENPDCAHYGGLQAAGDVSVSGSTAIVAVGLEHCHNEVGGIADRIAIWDVTEPSSPTFSGLMRVNAPGSDKIYSVGAIQIKGDFTNPNADYFLIFNNGARGGSYNRASIYVVQMLGGVATFYEEDESLFSFDTSALANWDEPQNSSLVADEEGKLFVVTTNKVDSGNKARSYEITDLEIDPVTLKVSNFSLVYKEERKFFSYNSASGSTDFGTFYKGASLSVGANGGVNLYSIENANDGINGSVLAGEYVGRTYDTQANCDTADGAYAVFYRDTNFKGKNLTMSYHNVIKGDNDFRTLSTYSGSINNKISSMKVCLPAGCRLAMYNSGSTSHDAKIFNAPALKYLEFPDLSFTTFPNGDNLSDNISGVTFLNLESCAAQTSFTP